MNVDFITPFISSMSNVLVTMASLSPQANGAQIKTDDLPPGDVTGLISMSSAKANCTLALSFSEAVILHIAENMLGEKFTQVNHKVIDLVGELTNMVSGGAKSQLESKGYDFVMTTPTVIQGKGQKISPLGKTGTIIIPFSTEAGDFYVEVCFQNK